MVVGKGSASHQRIYKALAPGHAVGLGICIAGFADLDRHGPLESRPRPSAASAARCPGRRVLADDAAQPGGRAPGMRMLRCSAGNPAGGL